MQIAGSVYLEEGSDKVWFLFDEEHWLLCDIKVLGEQRQRQEDHNRILLKSSKKYTSQKGV